MTRSCSNQEACNINEEVTEWVGEAYKKTVELIKQHEEQVPHIAWFLPEKEILGPPPALFKASPNVLTFRCGLVCSYLLEEFCPQMTYRKRELVPPDMVDATLSQISRLLVSSMLILSTCLRLEVNWHPSWMTRVWSTYIRTYVKNAEVCSLLITEPVMSALFDRLL